MKKPHAPIESSVIRILLVDDHPIVREGFRALLQREPGFEVCGEVGTVKGAQELIAAQAPHLAIVDVLLGNESGVELIRGIQGINPSVRILACSIFDDRLYAERALAAGATGYINKRAAPSQLIEAIRSVMSGNVFLSESMKQHIIHRSVCRESLSLESPIETLSNRELEIFKLIGHGLTTAEISSRLLVSTKTIETHRQNIRRHLQLDNTHKLAREAAQWVLENG